MRLKNLMLGAALLALTAVQASAQNVHLGLEAGGNLSNLAGTDLSSIPGSLSSRIGFVGGAFLKIDLGPSFVIQPEILYSQKGTQTTSGGGGSTLDLSYVEVPLLFKFYLPSPGIKPNFFTGGAVSFNTLAQTVNGSSSTPLANVNTTDIGIIAGLGVDFDKFSISARYELGLNNITTVSNIQNGTITVLAGYSFM